MKIDLNLLPLFLAVAEERSFSAAAGRLGITRSAVSQGIRRLEDGLQTLLVMRTTRSVSLTEAGERLRNALQGPIANIEAAFDDAVSDSTPRGQLRIAVTSIAEAFLSGPLLASFAAAHPEVSLDIFVSDEEFDIVAAGYDAGVRLGEVIEKDMIAVPLTGQQRERVVASPPIWRRAARLNIPASWLRTGASGGALPRTLPPIAGSLRRLACRSMWRLSRRSPLTICALCSASRWPAAA